MHFISIGPLTEDPKALFRQSARCFQVTGGDADSRWNDLLGDRRTPMQELEAELQPTPKLLFKLEYRLRWDDCKLDRVVTCVPCSFQGY